ncbi:3-methyladenine DNA glycosylase [Corynebacterium sp. 13CS0277]|uniref:DNA-3-methyladenine glycosylase I n=1 Tax=Corynebacterium sp. 13CS0277 TaxID=2071994 RepID=UPI000D02CBEC|nr:DNA-3-methyladenine glycosylase I [Corynebacterium sp. 13CS0277]PRQ10373.1 3-methyladenine DNA glycosylase [Corynebacterium sp. 13CS0277]
MSTHTTTTPEPPATPTPGAVCPVTGLVAGADGVWRPQWANTPMLASYYDTEWGISALGPGPDALNSLTEDALFERLSLEAFQAGLSWATILAKRPALRAAFHDFHVDTVAAFDEHDVTRLMSNEAILRNRRKIEATISNARATQGLRAEGGLADVIRAYAPPAAPAPGHVAAIPTHTEHSTRLAAALKKHGFRYVGPTTMYALFQALGVVNDRVPPAQGLLS